MHLSQQQEQEIFVVGERRRMEEEKKGMQDQCNKQFGRDVEVTGVQQFKSFGSGADGCGSIGFSNKPLDVLRSLWLP